MNDQIFYFHKWVRSTHSCHQGSQQRIDHKSTKYQLHHESIVSQVRCGATGTPGAVEGLQRPDETRVAPVRGRTGPVRGAKTVWHFIAFGHSQYMWESPKIADKNP